MTAGAMREDERLRTHALFPFVRMREDGAGRTPFVTLGLTTRIALLDISSAPGRVLYREDVRAAGLDPVDVYLEARARLARTVGARLVHVQMVRGPWDTPCVAFEHDFLASSCLVLPDLYERARKRLGTESMCVVTSRRDLLVVAPDLGPPFRLALRDLLGPRRDDGRDDLFRLEPSGPTLMLPPQLRPEYESASLPLL